MIRLFCKQNNLFLLLPTPTINKTGLNVICFSSHFTQELLTCWYMSFIILITCSFLVYLAERTSTVGPEDGKMVNLADGLYWGIVSTCLVHIVGI